MKVSESVANRVRNTNSSSTMITQTYTQTKENHVKLNKLFQYYAPVSYVLYLLIVVYAVIYLTFTFQNQSDLKLYINYKPVVQYQAYNSYSLLTPILSIIVAMVLAYTTRRKMELSDGDFFGILGVILFLACVTLHDGIGIYRLYWDDHTNVTKIANTSSVQGIAWDKAWSTRPDCLKHTAEKEVKPPMFSDVKFNVREKNWVLASENSSPSGKNEPSPMTSNDQDATQKKDENNAADTQVDMNEAAGQNQRSHAQDEDEETFDGEIFVADRISARHTLTVHQMCDGFNSRAPVDKPRVWMKHIQNELHCCGPRNDKQNWSSLLKNIQCDPKLQGCAGPFIEFLKKIFYQTYVIMHVETALLVLTMIMYSVHFVSMKKQKVEVLREYSLLRVTSQTSMMQDDQQSHKHDLDRSFSHHNKHHHRHHHRHSTYHDRRSRGRGVQRQSLVEKNLEIRDLPRTDVIFDLPEESHTDYLKIRNNVTRLDGKTYSFYDIADEYAQQKGQRVSNSGTNKSQPIHSSLKRVDKQAPPAAAVVDIASNDDNPPVQNDANAESPHTERFVIFFIITLDLFALIFILTQMFIIFS